MSSKKSARLLPLALQTLGNSLRWQAGELTPGLRALGHHLVCCQQHRSCSFQSQGAQQHGHELEEKFKKLLPFIQLQRDLKHEADLHDRIPYAKLIKMILARGAARDEKEAVDVSEALETSGQTLHHNGVVYLRPGEVADHVVPDFPRVEDLERKISEIDALIKPLEEVHDAAERASRRLLWGGFMVLSLQTVAFYHLTYNELSWDVMEPVAYMVSLAYSVIGYSYFMYTRGHVLDLQPFKESAYAYFKGRKLTKVSSAQLDEERYQHLLKVRTHYLKRLEVARMLEGKTGVPQPQ